MSEPSHTGRGDRAVVTRRLDVDALVRGFKVHANVVDPLGAPLVAR